MVAETTQHRRRHGPLKKEEKTAIGGYRISLQLISAVSVIEIAAKPGWPGHSSPTIVMGLRENAAGRVVFDDAWVIERIVKAVLKCQMMKIRIMMMTLWSWWLLLLMLSCSRWFLFVDSYSRLLVQQLWPSAMIMDPRPPRPVPQACEFVVIFPGTPENLWRTWVRRCEIMINMINSNTGHFKSANITVRRWNLTLHCKDHHCLLPGHPATRFPVQHFHRIFQQENHHLGPIKHSSCGTSFTLSVLQWDPTWPHLQKLFRLQFRRGKKHGKKHTKIPLFQVGTTWYFTQINGWCWCWWCWSQNCEGRTCKLGESNVVEQGFCKCQLHEFLGIWLQFSWQLGRYTVSRSHPLERWNSEGNKLAPHSDSLRSQLRIKHGEVKYQGLSEHEMDLQML